MSHIIRKINNQRFHLLTQRAIYWEEESKLIISDVHLGKSNYFRKEGIPVPNGMLRTDYEKLDLLISLFSPDDIIVIGDLFHNQRNKEWEVFCEWREQNHHTGFTLVRGNHDVFPTFRYNDAGIKVYAQTLGIGNILFTHDPVKESLPGHFTFSGHIHPGFKLHGSGNDSIMLPCYYNTPEYMLLPAFGRFTGLARVTPKTGDRVYIIAESEVVRVH